MITPKFLERMKIIDGDSLRKEDFIGILKGSFLVHPDQHDISEEFMKLVENKNLDITEESYLDFIYHEALKEQKVYNEKYRIGNDKDDTTDEIKLLDFFNNDNSYNKTREEIFIKSRKKLRTLKQNGFIQHEWYKIYYNKIKGEMYLILNRRFVHAYGDYLCGCIEDVNNYFKCNSRIDLDGMLNIMNGDIIEIDLNHF